MSSRINLSKIYRKGVVEAGAALVVRDVSAVVKIARSGLLLPLCLATTLLRNELGAFRVVYLMNMI